MQDAHEESKAVTKAAAMKGNLFPVGFLLILYKFKPMSTYSFCCLCSFLGDLWLCFIKTRIYNYDYWWSLLMLHKNKDLHVKNLQRKVARTKVGNIFCNHDMPRFLMSVFFIVCHFSLESVFQCQSCGTQLNINESALVWRNVDIWDSSKEGCPFLFQSDVKDEQSPHTQLVHP